MRVLTRCTIGVVAVIHIGTTSTLLTAQAAGDKAAVRMQCTSTEPADLPGVSAIGVLVDYGRRSIQLLTETGASMLAVPATVTPETVQWNAFVSDYYNFELEGRDRAQIGDRWCCVTFGTAPLAAPFQDAQGIGGSIDRSSGRTVMKVFVPGRAWRTSFAGTCAASTRRF